MTLMTTMWIVDEISVLRKRKGIPYAVAEIEF
jgi:hypothetical protein